MDHTAESLWIEHMLWARHMGDGPKGALKFPASNLVLQ